MSTNPFKWRLSVHLSALGSYTSRVCIHHVRAWMWQHLRTDILLLACFTVVVACRSIVNQYCQGRGCRVKAPWSEPHFIMSRAVFRVNLLPLLTGSKFPHMVIKCLAVAPPFASDGSSNYMLNVCARAEGAILALLSVSPLSFASSGGKAGEPAAEAAGQKATADSSCSLRPLSLKAYPGG